MGGSQYLILHLEDDISLKETVGELLAAVEPDSQVQQFTNSDDAIDYISRHGNQVDLYLLDVRVPGHTDGIGVAKQIREYNHSGTIVFMSAYPKPDTSVLSDDIRYEWINKPWSVERLLDVLERAKGQ